MNYCKKNILLVISLFVFLFFSTISDSSASSNTQLNRLRALGTAYMEEEDFENAIRVYTEAIAMIPESVSDTINIGIAHYHGDKNDQCIKYLKQAIKQEPDNPFANYTLGLAYKKIGDTTSALTYFQKTAAVDQSDAANLYNLGLANFNLKQHDEAAKWFKKTIEIDPAHTPSYYNLFLYYARTKKDMKTAKEMMVTFQKLKKTEPDRPATAIDEGKFLGPIEFDIPSNELPKLSSDLKVKFAANKAWTDAILEATDFSNKPDVEKFTDLPYIGRFVAAIPDLETRTTAIVVVKPYRTMLLIVNAKGLIKQSIDLGSGWTDCATADYDNDGDTDLFLYSASSSVKLLQNQGDWKLTDFTDSLNFPQGLSGCHDALWCDFDAEGDLDLLLAGGKKGDVILQNNGNGTFADVTGKIEGLSTGHSMALASSDLDNDNDLEIIRLAYPTDKEAGTANKFNLEIFSNLREVRFKKTSNHPIEFDYYNDDFQPLKLTANDMDNDGFMEICLLGTFCDSGDDFKKNSFLFKIDNKTGTLSPIRTDLDKVIHSFAVPQNIADVNNDGYEDILISNLPPKSVKYFGKKANQTKEKYSRQMLLNRTPLGFEMQKNVMDLGLEKDYSTPLYNYSSPQTADIDFDGDLDLLVTTHEGFRALENLNGNQNNSITLQVLGSKNTEDGIGAKILVKDDTFFIKKEISSKVTHLGLGERKQADVIRITWPNGIFQNLIHTTASQILSATEKPGYAGSCLFVYTWNGDGYDFIADSLCNAPLGLYVGGGYYPPNADEYIRIEENHLKARDGIYEIMMREELREITYLDQMELISASHPDAKEIHVNECFSMPPFPEFKLIGMSDKARHPKRVTDNHGNDVTRLVAENDYQYPLPWKNESRMYGVVKQHWFEIDLNDTKGAEQVYLFMTGYLDWPNSSNARSLEQNPEHDFVMPMLQVKDKQGEWVTVRNPMGFPAGKLKTVPTDVSDIFLSEDRTIRIVSTVQVHWDRIMVDVDPILEGFTVHQHPFKEATLRYGGYSDSYYLSEDGPKWYDYSSQHTNDRWDYQLGDFTRFGDVTPLLTEFDDMYIIIQHGDETVVHFDAPDKPLDGVTYFMKAVGWVKDLDQSTAYGTTVAPLPFKGMSAYPYGDDESYPWDEEHMNYYMEYNTRVYTRQNESLRIPQKIAAPHASPQAAVQTQRESE